MKESIKINDGFELNKAKEIKLFLILGDARSGTTFLANELSKYLPVIIPPESTFVSWLIKKFKPNRILSSKEIEKIIKFLSNDPKFSDWDINIESINRFIRVNSITAFEMLDYIFNRYRANYSQGGFLFGIKKNLIFEVDIIKQWFPNLSIIWMIRDGRAVYASKKNNIESIGGKKFAKTAKDAAITWSEKNNKIQKIFSRNNKVVHKVYYERLILDLENEISKIGDFLGVSANEKTMSHYQVPKRYFKIHSNVGKSPLASRVNGWENELTLQEIREFEWIAGGELLRQGYQISSVGTISQISGRIYMKINLSIKKCHRLISYCWHAYKRNMTLQS